MEIACAVACIIRTKMHRVSYSIGNAMLEEIDRSLLYSPLSPAPNSSTHIDLGSVECLHNSRRIVDSIGGWRT